LQIARRRSRRVSVAARGGQQQEDDQGGDANHGLKIVQPGRHFIDGARDCGDRENPA
jgi:hypothetical protein